MSYVSDAEHFKQPYDDDDDYISKTSIKKASLRAQELGAQLVQLSASQLEKMALIDEELLDAIRASKKIKPKTEAYRRHAQFIGKLMRQQNIDAIEQRLNSVLNKDNTEAAKIQLVEKIRDNLIAQGDAGVHELLTEHPQLDRQKLRHLVRSAAKEPDKDGEAKFTKELFQYLRAEIELL